MLPSLALTMPLVRVAVPPADPGWFFGLKLDGFRAVAFIEAGACRLLSRRHHVYRLFPRLCESLARLDVRNAVLDGEVVCLDAQGRSQFAPLLFRRGDPVFAAFDILWLNGKDLRAKPLVQRKRQLARVVPSCGDHLFRVDPMEGRGAEFFALACQQDLEGVVGKWAAGVYTAGKTTSWVKVKNPDYSQEEGRGELFERRGGARLPHTRPPELRLV
jgi:bifunctional non-homologous end joining protein LigD